ncbi:MAG: winged helix-turn-helix transcriptional regulator [Thermoplasmatota archaeon]
MTRPTLALAAAAFLAVAAPTAAQTETADDLLGDDGGSAFDSGLAWGLTAGGVGLVALAGVAYYLGIGGLRHVDRHNVLEHPLREQLMQCLKVEPGLHLRELANRYETAVTNTQWHLRKLEMAGLVKTQKVQGRRLYYPTEGGVQARERALQNAALRNPNAVKVLEFLMASPGSNQRTMAEALKINPGTIRWHLRRLESSGLLRSMPDGSQIRYFLRDVPEEILAGLPNAQQEAPITVR